jgi:hypothetical protein
MALSVVGMGREKDGARLAGAVGAGVFSGRWVRDVASGIDAAGEVGAIGSGELAVAEQFATAPARSTAASVCLLREFARQLLMLSTLDGAVDRDVMPNRMRTHQYERAQSVGDVLG